MPLPESRLCPDVSTSPGSVLLRIGTTSSPPLKDPVRSLVSQIFMRFGREKRLTLRCAFCELLSQIMRDPKPSTLPLPPSVVRSPPVSPVPLLFPHYGHHGVILEDSDGFRPRPISRRRRDHMAVFRNRCGRLAYSFGAHGKILSDSTSSFQMVEIRPSDHSYRTLHKNPPPQDRVNGFPKADLSLPSSSVFFSWLTWRRFGFLAVFWCP